MAHRGIPQEQGQGHASDQLTDPQLWARGFFGLLGDENPHPHQGPAFGGGIDVPMEAVHAVGADNHYVLSEIGGLTDAEIADAEASGAVGAVLNRATNAPVRTAEQYAIRMQRGELSRVDDDPSGWRKVAR